MVAMAIKKPFLQCIMHAKTCFSEQGDSGLIVGVHYGIELVQMNHALGIVAQCFYGSNGISLATMCVQDDDTHLSALVLGREMHQIDDTRRFALIILRHQPHLAVSIDVVTAVGDIIVQRITAVGHIGGPHQPQTLVVLYLIQQIEVFGFQNGAACPSSSVSVPATHGSR